MNLDYDSKELRITIDSEIFRLHPLWIRERSIEEDAVDQSSMQRLYDPEKISVNLEIKDAKEIDKDKILIKFSDNHEAKYCLNNLIKEIKRSKGLPKKVFWNKDNVIFQKFDFSYKDDEKKQEIDKQFSNFGQFKFNHNDIKAFGILGVSIGLEWKKIQKKFKKLVKKFHPDMNAGNKKYEDKLKIITLAYTQLKNTYRKKIDK